MKYLLVFLLAINGIANADDVQWAKGYTADCDNATEREDGSALDASEIASVRYIIIPEGGTVPVYTAIMAGGCTPTYIDTKKFVPVGRYFLHGITVDTDGRESAVSSPGAPLTVQKSRPNPPGGVR